MRYVITFFFGLVCGREREEGLEEHVSGDNTSKSKSSLAHGQNGGT